MEFHGYLFNFHRQNTPGSSLKSRESARADPRVHQYFVDNFRSRTRGFLWYDRLRYFAFPCWLREGFTIVTSTLVVICINKTSLLKVIMLFIDLIVVD